MATHPALKGHPKEQPALEPLLLELGARPLEERMAGLEGRKLREIEFHDRVRAQGSAPAEGGLHGNRKYYATSRASTEFVLDWIRREAPGRVVLDYACGDGHYARSAAKAGARLAIGIDISGVSIENARRAAERKGLADRARFLQVDCEDTKLPDASIDVALCIGMLHHLDLDRAFPELLRILKPGGKVLCLEALAYNPLARLYRRLTPHLRTEFEAKHILSFQEIRRARQHFEVKNIRFWHLTSLLLTPFRRRKGFEAALRWADRVDAVVLRVPGLGRMAWMFRFELHKPAEAASKDAPRS